MDLAPLAADLADEQASLDAVLSDLADVDWARQTPSPRWTVGDQVAHLTYFDETAATAITDPDAFAARFDKLWAAAAQGDEAVDALTLGWSRSLAPAELLAAWRQGRRRLAGATTILAADDRVAWYGPSMKAPSFLTARLMETWAHGQDIVDTVSAERTASDRLRHVARLGFITRSWTYANRGEDPPEASVRVDLAAPSGAERWTFGPDDADQSVTGPGEDFCLVVTQRRHLDDTSLVVAGEAASDWMRKSQAFAGPATDGPRPRSAR